jgi:hypothetical protein
MNKRMQQNRTDNRGRRPEVRDQRSVFCLSRMGRLTVLFSVFCFLTCALVPAGCVQQPSNSHVVKVRDGVLHIEQHNKISMVDLMETAEDVLAGMYFTIEKADVLRKHREASLPGESLEQNGIIRTKPLPGAQFFEFWRSDNVSSYNTLAANLHTIRRTVTLDISQQNKELRIGCDVQVQRLSLPERQVSSSARVYGMFSRSSPSLQKLQLNPEQKKQTEWIDLGRDTRLAEEILNRIETQIVKRTNHRLLTTENQT